MRYKRILLKLSGEALGRSGSGSIDPAALGRIAAEISRLRRSRHEVAVVIGGGNIWRGLPETRRQGIERVTSDYMGMLATVINALALQDALEKKGVPTRVLTALEMAKLAEPYIRRRAIRHLERGRVVIFAAGTGNPYLTTDTAAAIRASEIGAQVILKATKVDGVYTADPERHPRARRFVRLTFDEAIRRRLAILDAAALSLCRENRIPVVVFNHRRPGAMASAAAGRPVGTLLT